LLRDARTAMARHLENLLPPASRKRLELRMIGPHGDCQSRARMRRW
jgi:hypothetical protein